MGQRAGLAEIGCRRRQGKAEGKSKAARQRSRVAQESEALKKWAEQHGRPRFPIRGGDMLPAAQR